MRFLFFTLCLLVTPALAQTLTEEKKIDKIEVLESGELQVREANIIKRDGVEVSRTFNRYVLDPGVDDDRAKLNALPDDAMHAQLKGIAGQLWSQEAITKRKNYLQEKAAQRARARTNED